MNTTIPVVGLSTSDVAAIARLRAECKPWSVIGDMLEIPFELRVNLDLLPLFHPEWSAAYAAANKAAEADAFAEAQLVTRRLLQFAEEPQHRFAAMRRVSRRMARGRVVAKVPPLSVIPGNALDYRIQRGETLDGIASAYLKGIARKSSAKGNVTAPTQPPPEVG